MVNRILHARGVPLTAEPLLCDIQAGRYTTHDSLRARSLVREDAPTPWTP